MWQRRDWLYWLAASVIMLLLMAYIWYGYKAVPFHADEADHLYKSLDYVVAIVEQRPTDLGAQLPINPDSTEHIRLLTGNIHALLTGHVLWQAGIRPDIWPQAWYFPQSVEWNIAAGRWPSATILEQGRQPHTLLVMLSLPLAFIIIWKINLPYRHLNAIIAMILLGTHPVWLLNGRRVMQESVLIFSSLLLVLAGLWVLRTWAWWRFIFLAIAAGLCVAAKPTGAITIVGVYIGLSALLLREKRTWPQGFYLISSAIAATALYFLLTPALWRNPIDVLPYMIEERATVLRGQRAASPDSYGHFSEQWTALIVQPFIHDLQYYETPAFEGVLNAEIAHYESKGFAGWRGNQVIGWFWTSCTGIGLVQLWRQRHNPSARLILAWVLFTSLLTGISVALAWQRYYLLWVVACTLMAAIGFTTIIQWLNGFKFLSR